MATGIWTMKIDRQAKAAVSKTYRPRDGTQRGPGNAGDRPPPRARQLVAGRGDEELKAAHEHERAPDSLERPGGDEHGE